MSYPGASITKFMHMHTMDKNDNKLSSVQTHLDKSSNDTQASQAKVLERSSLACRVEERVQEQGNVG